MKSYKDFKSQINEVLKSNDPIEKWIDDFVHSKNPKFAGKTKAERIDMAKGAYYGAQKNEAYAASQNSTAVQDMEAVEYKGIGTDVVDKKKKLNPQPNFTTDKKQVKDFKEEAQIDELSKDTLASYAKKSSHDARIKQHVAADMKSKATHARNPRKKETWTSIAGKYQSQAWKREKGHDKAVDKLTKESVDINEDIKKEYDSLKKHDIKTLRGMIKQQHRIIDTSEFTTKEHAISHILNNKHGNKRVMAALGEETINELSKKTLGLYIKKAHASAAEMDRKANLHLGKYDNENHPFVNRLIKASNKRDKNIDKAVDKLTKEEAEQIDEISKKTLASYVNKASHDAASGAYQGKEYTAQSLQHTAAGDWDASKKKHDQATKEFNRANKRLANIPKATTKLAKEGFLNKSEEDDMQTLSAVEFYKKYGKNKTSHRKGRGTKSSDVEKYTEQVEESRGHKILNTFFKNREIAQRAFNGQNKPEEKKPVYNEKGIETPKVKTEDAYPTDEKWTDFDPKKHATNSKNKKGEK